MNGNVFHSMGDVAARLSAWVRGVWYAAIGKQLTEFERLTIMSLFSRLEALEVGAVAAVDRIAAIEAKPDVDTATSVDALTNRVAALEAEVGTPAATTA